MAKSKMSQFLDTLEKQYGSDGLFSAGSDLCEKVSTITTGSYSLDEALGVWGIPKGRIVQYAGQEKSGKTFMSLMAIKSWQQKDPNNWAVFVDAEYTFDPEWASTLGVDLDRLTLIKKNSGAEIFEMLCGVPNKEPGKPKKKNGLLDEIKVAGGSDVSGLGIIVLDSVAAIAPPMEISSESGKNNMALMARFLPPELRKIVPLLAETGVILIAINQVRVDPGVMWGNPETTPGGKAWKHFCSLMINFTMPNSSESKIYNSDEEQIGHIVRARIDKNKVGVPFKTCEFGIEYLKGVRDPGSELRTLAVKYGVVQRPNNRTYVYKEQKWSSKDEFATAFNTEQEQIVLLEEIKEAKLNGVSTSVENTENSEN